MHDGTPREEAGSGRRLPGSPAAIVRPGYAAVARAALTRVQSPPIIPRVTYLPAQSYDITLLLLRIMCGFIIWQQGAQKLFGLLGGAAAAAFTPMWFAGGAEFLGGLALAAGALTRPFAAVLAVDMAIRYVVLYLPDGLPPIVNRQGEITCLLFGITLLLAFSGPGQFSADGANPGSGWRALLARLRPHTPSALGVSRILIGLLFLSYGLRKMFGFWGEPEEFLSLQWYAGIIELGGGVLLTIGLFTRPVAFLCSGEMAFAYFINHNPRGFFPVQNGGERAALFCFFFLFLVAAGAGRWSIDYLATRKSQGARHKAHDDAVLAR